MHPLLTLGRIAVALVLLCSPPYMAVGYSGVAAHVWTSLPAAPLVVNFTYAADGACNGGAATVPFHSVVSGGTPPYNYSWNFGDGSPLGYGTAANHTYASSSGGPFNVTLTVKDAAGRTGSDTQSVRFLFPPCATPSQQPPLETWLVFLPFVVITIVLLVVGPRRGRSRP
jgi:PKD domain-containing protein